MDITAYFIDSETKTITPVSVEQDNIEQINAYIGSDCFTHAYFDEAIDDVIYVDDEGLLKSPKNFFRIDGEVELTLAGKGLMFGTDSEGRSISPRITLEDMKNRIQFLDIRDIRKEIMARK